MNSEYQVDIRLDEIPFYLAQWVVESSIKELENETFHQPLLIDKDLKPVFLFKSEWEKNYFLTEHKNIQLKNFTFRD